MAAQDASHLEAWVFLFLFLLFTVAITARLSCFHILFFFAHTLFFVSYSFVHFFFLRLLLKSCILSKLPLFTFGTFEYLSCDFSKWSSKKKDLQVFTSSKSKKKLNKLKNCFPNVFYFI